MTVPETLQYRIDHFRHYGRLVPGDMDLFGPASWLAVHVGQGNLPLRSDPLIDYRDFDGAEFLGRLRRTMAGAAQSMPAHLAYIERNCRAQ
jgi:tryptophan halogenase